MQISRGLDGEERRQCSEKKTLTCSKSLSRLKIINVKEDLSQFTEYVYSLSEPERVARLCPTNSNPLTSSDVTPQLLKPK